MSDLRIYAYGDGAFDLSLTRGDFELIGSTEDTWQDAVVQRVQYAVGTWLGESVFDTGEGFPWEQGVFGRQPVEGIASLLVLHLTQVPGVEAITSDPVIEIDNTTRRATIQVQIQGEDFESAIQLITQGVQQ